MYSTATAIVRLERTRAIPVESLFETVPVEPRQLRAIWPTETFQLELLRERLLVPALAVALSSKVGLWEMAIHRTKVRRLRRSKSELEGW